MISATHYAQRRQRLMEAMQPNSIAFIPSSTEILRNGMDNVFPFRQNSDFLYLTGFVEPDAVLVLAPGREEGETVLFNRPKNPDEEIWTGIRAGQQGACQNFGADQAFDIEQLTHKLPDLLNHHQHVYYPIGRDMRFDRKLLSALNITRNRIRKGAIAPQQLINIEDPLHAMRLIKSPEELDLMRYANKISSEGHTMIMQACKPGMQEYQLEAIIKGHCAMHNLRDMAYTPIVGTGKNACILHYIDNNDTIAENDIVLVDAGGEYQGYSSDITRSFPAKGKFSGEQRALYEVVLAAQKAAIEAIRPDVAWSIMQTTIVKTLTEGLVSLGILKGNSDELIEQGSYKPYYMHQAGHWLGLDTHDAGNYNQGKQSIHFAEHMVTTVEPGLYIAEGSQCDERWWNMGIRIEDNVIVTATGHENMTTVVKEIDDIEALMA